MLATLPGATRMNAKGKPYTADAATTVIPPILLFLGNAGKVMIANVCATFAACSVGDVDVSYRYLRVHCFSWVLYFSTLARDGVLLERPPAGPRPCALPPLCSALRRSSS